ncbi:MAG: fatty acid desaturase [Rhodoferax sp.]
METVRQVVDDLRDAKPGIYFADLLVSALAGWALFALAVSGRYGLGLRALAFLASSLLLYRALAFIHELFHQQSMKGFRTLWHALAGVPLLIPFLLYLPIHQAHHNPKTYGTKDDGEYDQFLGHSGSMSLKLFLLNMGLPIAVVVRFGVLTPLSVFIPVIRREVIPNFVHMALRMPYRAPDIKENLRRECYVVEVFCMLFAWGLVALCFAGQWRWVLAWYAMVLAIATWNTVRALGSTHLYVEQEQGRGAGGQLLDSLNINAGGWLTVLLCPVGLRYHALHHVAAYLPYHALAQAHQRLLEKLPAGSDYHRVSVQNLAEGWQRLKSATAA